MKNNDALNNSNNVMEYILLLPIDEQIYELDKIIKYHENYHHPHANVKQKYAIINQIKDFKKDLIIYHLQELRDMQIQLKTVLHYLSQLKVVNLLFMILRFL